MAALLSRKIQIIYGAGIGYAIIDQIFAQWVLYYYLPPKDSGLTALMSPLYLALALVISRVIDMVTDPLVGYLSDRSTSKWGRRRPFIAIGSVPLVVLTVLFFFPVKASSDGPTFIYLAIAGCLFFTFYTLVASPYNAMIPEISHSQKDRLNLATWQSVFRLIYTAIAMVLPGILIASLGGGNTEAGIRLTVIILSGIALISILTPVFGINEKKLSGGKSSDIDFKTSFKSALSNKAFLIYLGGFLFFFLGFNVLRASMNYYVVSIMGYGEGMITIASALLFGTAALAFYPINRLAKTHGYRKLMILCQFGLIAFSISIFMLGKLYPTDWGFVLFALGGIPVAGSAFILPPAMLSEISAVAAKENGMSIEGVFFGIQGFFLKMAFMLSIAILPFVLLLGSGVSFVDSMLERPDGVALTGVYATTLVAAGCFVLAALFYYLYPEKIARDE